MGTEKKSKIPDDAYTLDEVNALDAAAEAPPYAPTGRQQWPDPAAPKPEARNRFKEDGVASVLWNEITRGHAPNAVEPTTAAHVVAPMMMGGAPGIAPKVGQAANAVRNAAEVAGPIARRAGKWALKGAAALGIGHGLTSMFGDKH